MQLNSFYYCRLMAEELSTEEKFVDVKKLIASKNPGIVKWIPGFLIRYVEKILHQDEVNEFFNAQKGANAFEFSQAAMKKFNITIKVHGKENIIKPPKGVIFAANHPLGGFDAVAIISALRDIRPDLMFIVNDFLLSVENLKDRFVGVNKVGKNAAESLQRVDMQFASNTATFIFPAGLVSRKVKGEIKDLLWRKTFISKAKKYQKPVIPVYIEGRLTDRFYRLANFRKRIGLKFNIEMLYLVDELFKQEGNTMHVVIGKPISPDTYDGSKTDIEWSAWTKEQVYALKPLLKDLT